MLQQDKGPSTARRLVHVLTAFRPDDPPLTQAEIARRTAIVTGVDAEAVDGRDSRIAMPAMKSGDGIPGRSPEDLQRAGGNDRPADNDEDPTAPAGLIVVQSSCCAAARRSAPVSPA